ncbi:MAG: hypothetical protein FJX23_02190 [Alphaproteobacteria bacterium]|nr:hypothetical protein [Alphaproteobacteria bacterium]
MTRSALFLSTVIAASLVLSGCDSIKNVWKSAEPVPNQEGAEYKPERADAPEGTPPVDGAEPETATPVKKKAGRYEVLSVQGGISADASLADAKVEIPTAVPNAVWPQRGATASNAIGNLVGSTFDDHDATSIGKGKKWTSVLVTAPVVASGVVYAMDAQGFVSAHDAADIDKELWLSKVPVAGDDKDIMGGGLAAAGNLLFVSTGQGMVFGLSTKDGSQVWKRNLGIPVRSAPKLFKGVLYVTTIDDQLFALNAATGGIVWKHRGLGERVGFMTNISPAINDNLVVVGYGSGEIYGLAADSGQELWNDSLSQTNKTVATSSFTGFAGDPVIAGGVVYTASAGSLTTATHLISGQQVWDKPVSAVSTPWVAGDYLFQLTAEAQLVAIHTPDGRIKWVAQLPRFDHEEKQLDPYRWFGPILVDGELRVFGADGRVFGFSPETGVRSDKDDIHKDLGATPIVAGGTLYYVTRDAKLHALKD